MSVNDVTVILPCAGAGMRLGLPFPKELAPLKSGRCLIDSALDVIGSSPVRPRIIILDDGTREQTRDYVRNRFPELPLAAVRQHKYAPDWPDAVLRLEPWLSAVNVVMLPDASYGFSGDILGTLADATRDHGFAFAATRLPGEDLKSLGALRVVQDDTVAAHEDKPANPSPYNAAWGMLAFAGSRLGMQGMRVISNCLSHGGAARPPVIGAPVTWLDSYRDCGTWVGYTSEIARVNKG